MASNREFPSQDWGWYGWFAKVWGCSWTREFTESKEPLKQEVEYMKPTMTGGATAHSLRPGAD